MDDKYLDLLDEETQEFVRRTEAFYPPDAINASIEEQRKFYDELCNEFHSGYPKGVTASDRWISAREHDVAVRDYIFNESVGRAHLVFFHGGGFVVGGLESHDSICAEFCARTQCNLTAVDYRLAPEFSHPAAYDDCLNTFRRISDEVDAPCILVGDSAGGTLAASVCHEARSKPYAPIGQLLIYPALGGDQSKGSYEDHANAPMLTKDDMDFYSQIRGNGRDLSLDTTATPLADDDFSGLPPTVIVTAECDPLADDGGYYQDAIRAAGGNAVWFNEAGMVHGYLRARTTVKRAADSVTRMVDALNMLADREWTYG